MNREPNKAALLFNTILIRDQLTHVMKTWLAAVPYAERQRIAAIVDKELRDAA